MWLNKHERRLLAFYARNARQPNGRYRISDNVLVGWLCLPSTESLKSLKLALQAKGLISFTYMDRHTEILNVQGRTVPKEVEPNVTVTPEGFELGMKYNRSLFGPFQVWCGENWRWLLPFIATLVGIILSIMALRK